MSRKIRLISIYLLLSLGFSLVPAPVFLTPTALAETIWQEGEIKTEPANSGWQRMSPWYENTGEINISSLIKINYYFPSSEVKQIFSYNEQTKKWQSWASLDNGKDTVSATVSGVNKIALFLKSDSLSFGTASWYRYKNGLFAASPDFPKGTKLKVTNTANNKSVVVTVNDYGPNRKVHPGRVIDLDLVAFQKIAAKSAGVIKVKVEPVATATAAAATTTAVITKPIVVAPIEVPLVIAGQPEVNATSAIATWESSNELAYKKEVDKKLPLASLTKIVAMKVFLDTGTSLDKVVTYKTADENYNYQFCNPWESAKLTVKEGETMTVEDLLYSALVGSANNAVESLVRASGLSRDAFIAKMNSTVKKWGTTNTKFVEPTGLSPDNVSSASDYAIITEEALKDKTLQKVDTAKTYSFKTINTKKVHNLKNTSKLVQAGAYTVTASKTGYLNEAGYCLMSRVKVGKDNLIVVVFGATSSAASVESTKKIIEFATAK